MWIIAIVGIAGFILWQSNKRRAKRFVRAVLFLEIVEGAASVDSANDQVARLFSKHSSADEDNAAIRYALDKANRLTEGKQLQWIHEAREKGFSIDSGERRLGLAQLSQEPTEKDPELNFSEHFSEDQPYQTANSKLPPPPTVVSGSYHAAPRILKALNRKWVEVAETAIHAAIVWACWGALAGFILGWLVPMVGPFRDFAPWAFILLTTYTGALSGISIRAFYAAACWLRRY